MLRAHGRAASQVMSDIGANIVGRRLRGGRRGYGKRDEHESQSRYQRSHHDLTRAVLGHQVAQAFNGEHHRVEVALLQSGLPITLILNWNPDAKK